MMPDGAKNFFSLHLSIRQELCRFWLSEHKIHLSKGKKKPPKQISCGWLWCHDKNHWMMNRQCPEKGCYPCHKQRDFWLTRLEERNIFRGFWNLWNIFIFTFYISYTCVECGKDTMSYFASSWKNKNRGMFSANRTKHLILDLVKFNPGKFFIPCLLKSTDKRPFILLFFSVFVELFSSFVWDCLLFLSLRSIFQRLNRLIVFYFQNTTDFALCLTKTSMQRV